jgi:hypothetical protein
LVPRSGRATTRRARGPPPLRCPLQWGGVAGGAGSVARGAISRPWNECLSPCELGNAPRNSGDRAPNQRPTIRPTERQGLDQALSRLSPGRPRRRAASCFVMPIRASSCRRALSAGNQFRLPALPTSRWSHTREVGQRTIPQSSLPDTGTVTPRCSLLQWCECLTTARPVPGGIWDGRLDRTLRGVTLRAIG